MTTNVRFLLSSDFNRTCTHSAARHDLHEFLTCPGSGYIRLVKYKDVNIMVLLH